jgi:hypothetical protein
VGCPTFSETMAGYPTYSETMVGCPTSSTKPGRMSHVFRNHGGMSHIFNKTRQDVSCLQKPWQDVPCLQQNQARCSTFQKPHTFFITFLQTLHETAPNITNFPLDALNQTKSKLEPKKKKKNEKFL